MKSQETVDFCSHQGLGQVYKATSICTLLRGHPKPPCTWNCVPSYPVTHQPPSLLLCSPPAPSKTKKPESFKKGGTKQNRNVEEKGVENECMRETPGYYSPLLHNPNPTLTPQLPFQHQGASKDTEWKQALTGTFANLRMDQGLY